MEINHITCSTQAGTQDRVVVVRGGVMDRGTHICRPEECIWNSCVNILTYVDM